MCPGACGKPPGALPAPLPPPWPATLLHRLLRDEPGADGPPVRPHLAFLGRGHSAGLPLAFRPGHVQDRELRHHPEHVRQRVLPHHHERDPLPLPGLLSEDGQPEDGYCSGQMGQFNHLDGVTGGHTASCFLLHHSSGSLTVFDYAYSECFSLSLSGSCPLMQPFALFTGVTRRRAVLGALL